MVHVVRCPPSDDILREDEGKHKDSSKEEQYGDFENTNASGVVFVDGEISGAPLLPLNFRGYLSSHRDTESDCLVVFVLNLLPPGLNVR